MSLQQKTVVPHETSSSETTSTRNYEDRRSDLLKEIDLIQDVIRRMSNTSFVIKGWTVTMMGIIFAFKADINATHFVLIPIILFWFLDAYFLKHERQYRKLYQWVIDNRLHDDSHLFNLNTSRFNTQSTFQVMFSFTLALFYGGALLLVLLYFLSRLYFPDLLINCVPIK